MKAWITFAVVSLGFVLIFAGLKALALTGFIGFLVQSVTLFACFVTQFICITKIRTDQRQQVMVERIFNQLGKRK